MVGVIVGEWGVHVPGCDVVPLSASEEATRHLPLMLTVRILDEAESGPRVQRVSCRIRFTHESKGVVPSADTIL